MKYYLIGIKGAGLSSLAVILQNLGHEVAGYDDEKSYQFTEDKLVQNNIPVFTAPNDYLDENTIVVRSAAIKDDHLEIIDAQSRNLKIYEYNEMLGEISRQFQSITIAGTHGKTTTTSMLALIINNTIGCNYLIGDGNGSAEVNNKIFVFEACEYRRHFLLYDSYYSIITNIDLDHVDYYKDIEDVKNAFEEFANNTKKLIVAYGDDKYAKKLNVKTPILFYGINADNDIVAKNIEYSDQGMSFDMFIHNEFYHHFTLPLFGEHQLLNSLAVITICQDLGLDATTIEENLSKFQGAARRFSETIINNNVVIDDYAHHPKEVEVTIQAARQKYPEKTLIPIFWPHTFSRTQEFHREISTSLNKGDVSFVLDVYPARENQNDYPNVTSHLIVDNLNNGRLLTDVNQLKNYDNAVFLFMSPKDIRNYRLKLIKHLEKEKKE